MTVIAYFTGAIVVIITISGIYTASVWKSCRRRVNTDTVFTFVSSAAVTVVTIVINTAATIRKWRCRSKNTVVVKSADILSAVIIIFAVTVI
jgi:arginine deiminase